MKYCGGIAKNSRCRKIVKGKREEEGSRPLVFTTTSQQARNPTLEPGSQSKKSILKMKKKIIGFLSFHEKINDKTPGSQDTKSKSTRNTTGTLNS